MSYTLNRGIESEGLDGTQRGLLIGLPAIALILSFGALHKHVTHTPAPVSPATVPIVSTLSFGTGSNSNTGSPGSTGSSPQTAAPASGATSMPAYTSPLSIATSPSSSGTSSGDTGVVGGRGGGPTGGGSVSLPDCSLNQIATVDCQVPACSPEITLAPGQKAILGLDGTCIIVN